MESRSRTDVRSSARDSNAGVGVSGGDMEQWKDIPGYEGRYQVSDHGRVRSVERKVFVRRADGDRYRTVPARELAQFRDRDGYCRVSIASAPTRVHTLVLLAFEGPRPKGFEVAHANGDPSDNRLGNLRYATPKENAADRDRHGTTRRGERHACARVSDTDVDRIRQLRHTLSQKTLAKLFGLSQSQISAIQLQRSRRIA